MGFIPPAKCFFKYELVMQHSNISGAVVAGCLCILPFGAWFQISLEEYICTLRKDAHIS